MPNNFILPTHYNRKSVQIFEYLKAWNKMFCLYTPTQLTLE